MVFFYCLLCLFPVAVGEGHQPFSAIGSFHINLDASFSLPHSPATVLGCRTRHEAPCLPLHHPVCISWVWWVRREESRTDSPVFHLPPSFSPKRNQEKPWEERVAPMFNHGQPSLPWVCPGGPTSLGTHGDPALSWLPFATGL